MLIALQVWAAVSPSLEMNLELWRRFSVPGAEAQGYQLPLSLPDMLTENSGGRSSRHMPPPSSPVLLEVLVAFPPPPPDCRQLTTSSPSSPYI